jgi:hypothetical protein
MIYEVNIMRTGIALAVTLSVFFWTSGYSDNTLYTWKDDQGTLNITDTAPPDGAEIIDISPAATPPKKKTSPAKIEKNEKGKTAKKTKAMSMEKKELLSRAAKLRDQEASAVKQREELLAEIESWEAKKGTKRKRRRNKRNINKLQQEVEQVSQEAETAGRKAAALEKKAAELQ